MNTSPIRLNAPFMHFTLVVIATLMLLLLLVSGCGDEPIEQPQISFDKTKWMEKVKGNYPHRKQMVKDLLTNYKWAGVSRDSVILMLGKEDVIEEGNLTYYYDSRPFLGGLGTSIEAVVFELAPDSSVKVARLNDGGWD